MCSCNNKKSRFVKEHEASGLRIMLANRLQKKKKKKKKKTGKKWLEIENLISIKGQFLYSPRDRFLLSDYVN